ncbi:Lipopolysaccharide biosynthesis protein, LPS:glycosyltransferase [Pedobacter sp. ok626]|uniref:glycosyltransferase family 8 protein n=1 Tax=Pedobacter sp. ok626 TaxID=1761882 RepID=UPI000888F6D1|nr:glycosyltransferase family 8 protein [Pedobacter sp. ok626]SDJ56650.1 Lipopolysaccharide biosynthesis protein, LPS:glycosyltransferase [Pedobacter sp. ok626]
MKNNNNISIVVASDNHYAILIAALLKSIEVNHKTEEHIDFHIIDDGISPKVKKKLSAIADPKMITLKWFKSKEIIPSNIVIPVDNSAFPLTVYMRVFSPYVVDPEVSRLIYLDVDTIVQDDISKLWNIDLGNYTVAAAQDVGKTVDCEWGGIKNYKDLGLTADTKYFNSGVLVINPKKWREEDLSNQVITALSTYKEYVQLADQYGLNVVLANKWQMLDPKWNWFAFQEDKNPSLVHFLDIKPIFTSYNSQAVYRDEFYRYLSMTPWKGFKPISGNQRYVRKVINKIKKAFLKL